MFQLCYICTKIIDFTFRVEYSVLAKGRTAKYGQSKPGTINKEEISPMRNLKKVLALVLAMALTLTMFAGAVTTVPKASDYDTLSSDAKEAVSVLTALGVINGYPDGTFKGDGIVTRAELAKMIYVMKTGDTAAAASFYANADLSRVFKDSVDAWAVPYINYCYLNSIIVGYEDGTVRANNAVTGVEAAKIALVALGYAPKTEGLEGSGFYSNTMRLSSVAGLLKNVSGNMSAGMTRADTAILLYNALYANTVYYVGGAATAKTSSLSSSDTITLGEEGFNLLDVTGVLVANDEIGLSAYWKDVLDQNTMGYMSYKDYDKAASGQSRFVYKDYVAASTANSYGYYVDKVVTVNVDTSAADLGREYRLLITKASNSTYSSTEVRTVYGVIGEVAESSSYDLIESTCALQTDDDAITDVMFARYQAYRGSSAAYTDIDGTIYINGVASSFAAAEAALALNTTASVTAIDNDDDGTVDHLFIAKYTLGVISSVSDTSTVLLGAGTLDADEVSLTNGDVAKRDYVALYYNAIDEMYYVKKLTAVTSNITGYNGSKYTIDGASYAVGSLYTGNYLEGYNSVNSAIYTFYMDTDASSNYIAFMNTNSQTNYEKYAIIAEDYPGDTIYGQPQIKLYTEDNEYVYGTVASINGMQVYDSASYWAAYNAIGSDGLDEDNLVSYIKSGSSLYLYTADYYTETTGEYFYTTQSDTWATANGTPIYKNQNGVVFVSYGAQSAYDDSMVWRAYSAGEFQVAYGSVQASAAASQNSTIEDVIISNSNNYGVNYIKAAAIAFDYAGAYTLPGLSTVEGSDIIATVTAKTNAQYTDGAYVYTYTVLNPWSTSTTSYTTTASAGVITDLAVGNVYRLFLDADGKIERYELLLTANNYNSTAVTVTGYTAPATSYGTQLQIFDTDEATFYVDYSGTVHLFIGTASYTLDANANVYFVKYLGTTSLAKVDWAEYVSTTLIPDLTDGSYRFFIDFNASTGAINNLWIDVAAPAMAD